MQKKTLLSALLSLGAVLALAGEKPRLEITRTSQETAIAGAPENMSGKAQIWRFNRPPPERVNGAIVAFAPGARTAWHTHPLGQTLIVTEGCGWVQIDGAPKIAIRPGDIIWTPAGAKHWHGASTDSGMTHVAIVEAVDGKSVDWMEHVTEENSACKAPKT